ncbi:Inorganic pyrophosphatase Ppa [Candidatus Magnetomoraceae bacterium gMMP-15]
MPLTNFIQKTEKFEIKAYKKPKDLKSLAKHNIAFSGSPQKHPYDSKKVILVSDPYSTNTFYYEFSAADISAVEELPNLVTLEGESITMARIWVKKGSIGIRSTPFLVEDMRNLTR